MAYLWRRAAAIEGKFFYVPGFAIRVYDWYQSKIRVYDWYQSEIRVYDWYQSEMLAI